MKATASALLVVLLLCSASAQEKPDFSGLYLLDTAKPGKHQKAQPLIYLRVTQSERVLEATLINPAGQRFTSKYFLDGSPSQNLEVGEFPSKDSARFRGKALLIESVVQVHGTALHQKQKWQLSRKSETLTIHLRSGGSSGGKPSEGSRWNQVYTRQP